MKALKSGVGLSVMWLLLLALGHPAVASGQAGRDNAVAFVQQYYVHGVPYAPAHDLGPSVLPTLAGMLRDEDQKSWWSNIVTTIGYIGHCTGYDTLRSFTWDRFEGEVDLETFQALIAAQGVLGHIAAFDCARALEEIETGVDPRSWNGLPWKYRNWEGRKLAVLWSKLSINALSYTGKEGSASVLARLQEHPYAESQRSNIEEGISRNEMIKSVGLQEFERVRSEEIE